MERVRGRSRNCLAHQGFLWTTLGERGVLVSGGGVCGWDVAHFCGAEACDLSVSTVHTCSLGRR